MLSISHLQPGRRSNRCLRCIVVVLNVPARVSSRPVRLRQGAAAALNGGGPRFGAEQCRHGQEYHSVSSYARDAGNAPACMLCCLCYICRGDMSSAVPHILHDTQRITLHIIEASEAAARICGMHFHSVGQRWLHTDTRGSSGREDIGPVTDTQCQVGSHDLASDIIRLMTQHA